MLRHNGSAIRLNLRCCWPWNPEVNAFLVPIRIANPSTRIALIKWCIFDTGFTGYLGLDPTTIKNLDLPELGHGIGATITGNVDFVNYSALAELVGPDQENLSTFHSTENSERNRDEGNNAGIIVQEFKIPLLGSKAITQFSWLILKAKKILCLISE